jgi:glycerophosphoryl diester phosphodiesterase
VFAWTVDDPARMQLLIDAGVDAVCTNRPDVARTVTG